MKTKCPYCGEVTEIRAPQVEGGPSWIDVIPAELKFLQLGQIDREAVIVVGLQQDEMKMIFSVTVDQWQEAYKTLGTLIGMSRAQEEGVN